LLILFRCDFNPYRIINDWNAGSHTLFGSVEGTYGFIAKTAFLGEPGHDKDIESLWMSDT
jgi:hypothetical protein